MSRAGEKCLVVVDKKNKLLGTLSDGDVRKAILNRKIHEDKILIHEILKEKMLFLEIKN